MSDHSPIRLRLLGPPALGRAADAMHALERKDAALLALLALEGARGREELASLLWPESPPHTAAGSLRQRIFRLRRRLGHDLVQAGERVQLLADVLADVSAPGAPNGDEPALLAGCQYDDCEDLAAWVELQRQRRRAQRLDAMAALAATHESRGELAAALEVAQRLVAEEPLSEHAARREMRLHYLRGDRAAALEAFERCERRLKDELGTRPGAETLALLTTIEGGRPPALAVPRTPVPASLQRPPRLVGRHRELMALAEARAAGQVCLLLGEAGMGKSRLLAEWAAFSSAAVMPAVETSRPGFLTVAARPGDAGVPYALLARLLRALFERAPQPADPATRRELARVLPEWSATRPVGEAQRLVLQQAVEEVLAGSADADTHGAGLAEVLLDDLQFADAASLELLQGLIAGERLRKLRWGLAQRPGQGEPAVHALRDALIETRQLREVVLSPLDIDGMTELVASLGLPGLDAAALAAPLVRHTGGNPLFALETLKSLVLRGASRDGGEAAATGTSLPQPATVSTLIERRLRALTPDALALARVAAIAGSDFDIELAEAVLQRPALALADAWAELQAAQVLTGSAFAHDLVADVVARSVPEEIARRVHGAVAAHLDATGRDAATVADHWQRAGRIEAAARAWEQASRRAADAGRAIEALSFAAQAADGLLALGQAEPAFDALFRARRLAISALDSDGLRQWAERLEQMASSPLQRAQALGVRAHHAAQVHDVSAAESLARRAQHLARALGDVATVVHAGRSYALTLVEQGRDTEALAALQDVMDDGVDVLDEGEKADLRSDHAFLLSRCGQCRRAVDEYDAALDAALRQQSWQTAQIALSNSAIVCVMLGRLPEALERHERAMALPVAACSDSLASSIDEITRGSMLIELGRLGEALDVLLRVAPVVQRADRGHWALQAVSNLAHLWLLLGQPARAQQLVTAAQQDLTHAPPLALATQQLRLARLLGRSDPLLLDTVRRLRAEARLPLRQRLAVDIELALALPPPERAVRLAGIAAEAAAAEYFAVALGAEARRLPALLEMREDAQAADLAARVDAESDRLWPFDLYLPALWLDMHEAWRRAGLDAPACAVLERARAWIDRAVQSVPEAMRESFLLRNAVNRELRARASRVH